MTLMVQLPFIPLIDSYCVAYAMLCRCLTLKANIFKIFGCLVTFYRKINTLLFRFFCFVLSVAQFEERTCFFVFSTDIVLNRLGMKFYQIEPYSKRLDSRKYSNLASLVEYELFTCSFMLFVIAFIILLNNHCISEINI